MIYVIVLVILFSVLLINYLINRKRKRLGLNKALHYIDKKYNINMDEARVNKLGFILVFANTFIVYPPVCLAFTNINYWILVLISIIWFSISILITYNVIGLILKKKGW